MRETGRVPVDASRCAGSGGNIEAREPKTQEGGHATKYEKLKPAALLDTDQRQLSNLLHTQIGWLLGRQSRGLHRARRRPSQCTRGLFQGKSFVSPRYHGDCWARARDKVLAPLSCFGAIFVLRPLCCLCCGLEARGSRKKQKKKSLSTIWRETHPTMRDDTLISTATAAGLTQAAPEEATEAAAVAEEATADAAAAAAARLVN